MTKSKYQTGENYFQTKKQCHAIVVILKNELMSIASSGYMI